MHLNTIMVQPEFWDNRLKLVNAVDTTENIFNITLKQNTTFQKNSYTIQVH